MRKKLLRCSAFIIITICVVYGISVPFRLTSYMNKEMYRSLYQEPDNSYDALIVGGAMYILFGKRH